METNFIYRMPDRITDKDLYAVLERLNRCVDIEDENLKYHLVHQYGKCYLMKNNGSIDISSGNTKPELYWQLITACRIIENFKK